jgi:hypothetical protein
MQQTALACAHTLLVSGKLGSNSIEFLKLSCVSQLM